MGIGVFKQVKFDMLFSFEIPILRVRAKTIDHNSIKMSKFGGESQNCRSQRGVCICTTTTPKQEEVVPPTPLFKFC